MSEQITRLRAALEGRYEIERELGQGGMATVYLARDLKHNRNVALKVLKPELAAVVGADRFLAEIETTANLQHPHILPLFDSGEAGGFLFYVMPYVEGETLADRIAREKQLPVDEALGIATSVASALQHAHDRGVIHRDIKPGNILLQDGQPVVGDFGIALAVGSAGGARLTETGLSVGTPYYMSPEQATGDQMVGPASDTYALACVLYEMLTGEPPYPGNTAQAVLGKIIQGLPVSATAVRKSIPPNVDAAIRRALEKLPADRFTGAHAFAKALADPGFRHGTGPAVDGASSARLRRVAIGGWATAAAAVVGLAWGFLQPTPSPPVQRFSLPFQLEVNPALLPDGSGVVLGGSTGEGRAQLLLRTWDDLTPRPVAGTEGFLQGTPVVSPDGREVAFISEGQLRVASLEGGNVRTLADGAFCCQRWSADGYVYYSPGTGRNIVRVRAAGGAVEQVVERRDEDDGPMADFQLLPGGDVAVFTVWPAGGPRIEAVRLSTGERKILTPGSKQFVTSTGHLVFGSLDNEIRAAPFDADALELTGAPVTVVEGVVVGPGDYPVFDVSASGALTYMTGGDGSGGLYEFVWMTREGEATPIDPEWRFDPGEVNSGWSLSPDGTRLAVREQTSEGADIWIKELPTGPRSRLTFHEALERKPRWTSDSRSVTFLSERDGDLDIWTRNADGTGEPRKLFDFERGLAEGFWSPGEEWLILRVGGIEGSAEGARDIMGFRPGVDSAAVPLVATSQYAEESPAISPDGRWLAYASDETGRAEIYVRPFPDVDSDRVAVSRSGGFKPLWGPDGSELFFVNPGTRELMSAAVETTSRFQVRGVESLFTIPDGYFVGRTADFYDVSRDGERFLMARLAALAAEFSPELILVQNWFEELKERVPR